MRNRLSLLLGLIALLAVAMPSLATAGVPVSQDFSCNRGSFLVGFQGHMGAWIDQIQPVCAPWNATNGRLGPVYAGDNFGNVNGGNPRLTTALCLPGSAMVAVIYGRALPNGPPGHVQDLNVQCAPLSDPQRFDSSGRDLTMGAMPTRIGGTGRCLPGLLANGLTIGLDGINITDIVLRCDSPATIMAAAGPASSTSSFSNSVHAALAGSATSTPPAPPPPKITIKHLGKAKPPSSAPVQGSWFVSCSKASLYGNVLSASCKTTTGVEVGTSLDLDSCNQPATAGNMNGKLVCESGVAGAGGGAAAPSGAPSASAVVGSDVIEGDWQTSEGAMTFTQNDDELDGSYSQDSGRIAAQREGDSWVGFWSESKSDHRCDHPQLGTDYWGRMEFGFSDQNRHFEGMWSYCGAPPASGGKWTGDRVK